MTAEGLLFLEQCHRIEKMLIRLKTQVNYLSSGNLNCLEQEVLILYEKWVD